MEKLIFNLNGTVRRVTEGGVDYYVVPMTTITPDGVLPGSKGALLYPRQETYNSVADWDSTPIVVYHPERNGQHCSAADAPEKHIGQLRNSEFDASKGLQHEGWIDVAKLRKADRWLAHNGRPQIEPSIVNGQPVEVSTGLYTTNLPAANGYAISPKGRPYTAVATDFRPDHLAILPDQVGACSVNDGCGLLVNERKTANYIVNPVVSEAQRRYLNSQFGHPWVKEHGFDNRGKLPETANTHANQYTVGTAVRAASAAEDRNPAADRASRKAIAASESGDHAKASDLHETASMLHAQAAESSAGRAHDEHMDASKAHLEASKMHEKLVRNTHANQYTHGDAKKAAHELSKKAITAADHLAAADAHLAVARPGDGGEHMAAAKAHIKAVKGMTSNSWWRQLGEKLGIVNVERHHHNGQFSQTAKGAAYSGFGNDEPRDIGANRPDDDGRDTMLGHREDIDLDGDGDGPVDDDAWRKQDEEAEHTEKPPVQPANNRRWQNMTHNSDESMEDRRSELAGQLTERFGGNGMGSGAWIVDMYDDKIVYQFNGKYNSLPYTEKDGECKLSDVAPVEVKRQTTYEPANNKKKEECPECGGEMEEDEDGDMRCEECGHEEDDDATENVNLWITYNRNWPQSKRDKLDAKSFAGPDQSFPIATQADVDAAMHSVGRTKHDPEAIKAGIRRIAKKKGLTMPELLTKNWGNKQPQQPKPVQQPASSSAAAYDEKTKLMGGGMVINEECPDCGKQMKGGKCECGYTENTLSVTTPPAPVGGGTVMGQDSGQNLMAHAASQQAAVASMDHPPARDKAISAFDHSAAGRSPKAATRHDEAADAHDDAAQDSYTKGDVAGGDSHANAAMLHRKASAMHSVDKTVNNVNPEGHNQYTKGGGGLSAKTLSKRAHQATYEAGASPANGRSHKEMAKAHTAMAAEREAGNAPRSAAEHRNAAAAHQAAHEAQTGKETLNMKALERLTPEQRKAKLKELRPRMLKVLTTNCKCKTERQALNGLNNETLAILVNAKQQGSNADAQGSGDFDDADNAGGWDKSRVRSDDETFYDNDDEDKAYETEDDAEDEPTNTGGGTDKTRGRVGVGNQLSADQLEQFSRQVFGAPLNQVRGAVTNQIRHERREKIQLIRQVVGHLSREQQTQVVNKMGWMRMSLGELQETLPMLRQHAQPTHNAYEETTVPEPLYLGANDVPTGNERITENADQNDVACLVPPTINFRQWAEEDRLAANGGHGVGYSRGADSAMAKREHTSAESAM